MKAIRFHKHGGYEVLQYEDISEPSISESQVLVQVKACALNHLDLWVREGMPGVKTPLPLIPGCEMSGIILNVGSDVKNYHPGDEVILSPGTSCGICEHCLRGWDNLCRYYGIIGETQDGCYCEKIAVSPINLLPKPSNLSFEEAASIPLAYLTSWHMLVTQGQISPGQLVLIHAAGSGIGSTAIQIAKLFNATVLATASTQDKLEKAKELGADYGINYKEEDFLSRVKEITKKRGVDIVFEHTGEKTFEGSYKSLCKGGRLITCGATSGWNAKIDLRYLFSKHLKIIGTTMGSKGELVEIMKHIQGKTLRPIVDKTFPLQEAAEAQVYLAERKNFGKVLVIP